MTQRSAFILWCCLSLAAPCLAGELAGNKFLVTSIRTGDTEVFIVDPETGDATNVTRSPSSEDRYPCWSPDARQIAFTSNREGGTYNLFVCDVDGANVRALTHEKTSGVAYMPSWVGDRIVFGFHREKPEMASIRPDGSELKILGAGHDPSLSPDGTKITYTGEVPGGVSVWVMNTDGSDKHLLVKDVNKWGAIFPSWSPDGKQIVYSFKTGEALELFIIDADGAGSPRQLTHLNKVCTPSAWSPDGKWISFRFTDELYWQHKDRMEKVYAEKPGDKRPVWVIRPDGTDAHLIEALHYQCAMDGSRAAWRPLAMTPVKTDAASEIGKTSVYLSASDGQTPQAAFEYKVTWVGNSLSGANDRWVQNFFLDMVTAADGTCYSWSHWDEGGKKFGVYKDGDVIANKDVHANSRELKDKSGRTWKLNVDYVDPKNNEWDFTPKSITCNGKEVTFPDLYVPTALSLANDGSLMIADSQTSPRQQVLFYDVSDLAHPKLVREFGDRGGIGSGTPGQVTPTKFFGIRGIGTDKENNIYVASSEMGSVLRKLTPGGNLVWELYDHFFVDVACADPMTDGRDVWGIQEHYAMDYSKPAGKDTTWVGYSLDRHKYPNDPRGLTFVKQQGEHGLTTPQIVYLEGKRFMFVGGMFASNFINIFRYDGEIAVPSGLIMQWGNPIYRTSLPWPPNKPKGTYIWRDLNGDGDYQADEFAPNTERVKPGPFWVDKKGNIWMAYGFFRYDFQGLDGRGNPIYSADKITVMGLPKGMKNIARVWYDVDSDTLVAAEQGVDERGHGDMRHIGRVFTYKNYLGGNRDATSFISGAGPETGCVTAAGDYVFTGGWKERARVHVNRISDGAEVGVFDPGPSVGGVDKTGWVDILTGITAHKKSDGEYLIFVEEDFRGKSILYRWKPSEK